MVEREMDLTVVIVNYNVEHFLAQCLVSVERAVAAAEDAGYHVEICVVDNHSLDGSCAMVRKRFANVRLWELPENLGFSRANNLAVRATQGRWVLLLNPDTVVKEDGFIQVLRYADAHPRLGGMGVPMVDGQGRYLPESKRGLPDPWSAFCKITGLYRLAPRTRTFNRYYMGHIDRDQTAPIEILSGAYMLLRREALDQVGLLDETYFMYGEDIDLSWRLIQGGWENHYFAGTSIIHYKGESTKKGSLNYVLVFYKAMLIFTETHFAGRQAQLLSQTIRLAIYARAGLAIGSRLFARWGVFAGDWVLLWAGWMLTMWGYSRVTGIGYDERWAALAFAGYTGIWVASLAWMGGYERPWRLGTLLRAMAWATGGVLIGYALVPEDLRFSRAILLMGSVLAGISVLLIRSSLHPKAWLRHGKQRRLYVGSGAELERMVAMVRAADLGANWPVGEQAWALDPGGAEDAKSERWVGGPQVVGGLEDLPEAIRIHRIQEVILSGRDVSAGQIIDAMSSAAARGVNFRIAWSDSEPLMGSGGPVAVPLTNLRRSLQMKSVQRGKRLFDVLVSGLLLPVAPILWVTGRRGWGRQAWGVMRGQRTWVGYAGDGEGLPPIRTAVIRPQSEGDERMLRRMDLAYARDYRWTIDLSVVVQALILRRGI
jgi:GT2 family glycosyltransferase